MLSVLSNLCFQQRPDLWQRRQRNSRISRQQPPTVAVNRLTNAASEAHMAREGAKKRAEQNKRRINFHGRLILVSNVLYVLLRFVVRYKTVVFWRHVPLAAFSLVLPMLCYYQLSKAAKATYDNGELLDGGADLNAGGIPGYLQDGIWVTVAVQFLTAVISDWFWFLYLLPVTFAIWKVGGFLWPMLMPSHSQEAEETPDERRKRDKKQSKAERAEKRGKMKVRR